MKGRIGMFCAVHQAGSVLPDLLRRYKGMVVPALIAVSLGSCRGDTPEPAFDAAPPETAARAPAPTVADPELLTPDGWGPLRIGMSRAEVISAAGGDANPAAIGGPEPERCDEFHPIEAAAGILVMIEQGVLTRISVSRNPEVKTAEGLGVGDSATRVLAAYGSRARVEPHKYWPDPAKNIIVWLDAPSDTGRRGIRYETDASGKVVHVRAGTRSIEYVEGCL